MATPLLEIKDLQTTFYTEHGSVKASNHVNVTVNKGEIVCLVGESGCGKSVTAMSIMKLIEAPGVIEGGQITFQDQDILTLGNKALRNLRGNDIAMIFQEPMSALNPVYTIGDQMMEPLLQHTKLSKNEAYDKCIELMEKVGLSRTKQLMKSYPHELSGGMLQRIMIAIALSCDPKLIIADEPTTALDVTIQAQILEILKEINKELQTSILFITHDLGVVAEMADRVVVMYAGKVVEEGTVLEIFKEPKHPYTKGLLHAKPVINKFQERLYTIPGQVPDLSTLGDHCFFQDRCEYRMDICGQSMPALTSESKTHCVACWLYKEAPRKEGLKI